jgi:general secretion pathway protein L
MAASLDQLRHTLRRFFAWWLGELKATLPPRLARILHPDRPRIVLEPTASAITVRHGVGDSERELGAVAVDEREPAGARVTFARLVEGVDVGEAVIALRLSAAEALRKIVDLPSAAAENLSQVLAFEMDRLTPFAADAVYFDHRITREDDEARRIQVEITLLPRAAVDPVIAKVRALGIEPRTVDLLEADGRSVRRSAVALPSQSPRRSGLSSRLSAALGVLAAVLMAALVYVPLERQRQHADALEAELAAARDQAEAGRRLQAQIEQREKEGRFIIERKLQRPPFVAVLDEVTRLLPDDTWLFRLRFAGNEIQTFGYSPSASTLIGTIEASPLFVDAQFRAPLTRDPRVGAEQFHIAFQMAKDDEG